MTNNKHGSKGSRWVTVPNSFPDPDDISSTDWYHMFEGYCIGDFETKRSGKNYKKVRTMYCDSVDNLLRYFNYDNWYLKYKVERNPFKRFFISNWTIRQQ